MKVIAVVSLAVLALGGCRAGAGTPGVAATATATASPATSAPPDEPAPCTPHPVWESYLSDPAWQDMVSSAPAWPAVELVLDGAVDEGVARLDETAASSWSDAFHAVETTHLAIFLRCAPLLGRALELGPPLTAPPRPRRS